MNVVRSRYPVATPRRVYLGDAETTPEEKGPSTSEIVLPIVKTLLEKSATRDVEVLKARAENFRRLRDRARKGSAFWTLYDNQYRVALAKLRAAQVEQQQEREDRASKLQVVELGKVGITVGIVGGAALVVLLLNLAGAAKRHGRA